LYEPGRDVDQESVALAFRPEWHGEVGFHVEAGRPLPPAPSTWTVRWP